jgi:hypothetical protein
MSDLQTYRGVRIAVDDVDQDGVFDTLFTVPTFLG